MASTDTSVRFAEAIDFLRRRLALPDGRWGEMLREVDAAATDRARGMSDALVRDVLEEALKAVEDGSALGDFMDGYTEALRRHGWEADEEEIHRSAALAFRMMTSQAYAAGRWQQIQRLKRVRPYLRYVTIGDDRVRDEHADWHDVILPVDHPWWEEHFPPNGWNCRCYVQSLSVRDVERYGFSIAEEAPEPATRVVFVRGRDGIRRPVETPVGIDPGFAVNWGEIGLRLPQTD